MVDSLHENGWNAVPRDPSKIFTHTAYNHEPKPLPVQAIAFPEDSDVVRKVYKYAKEHLPPQTLNHSMRVYYYGMAILEQQFPEHASQLSPVTLALASLLHDLGTTPEHMSASRMSFEFFGALRARELLLDEATGASQDTADAVCETIIRHQDLGTEGTITFLGQLIQLATIFDNVGGQHPSVPGFERILHKQTREDVIAMFPRTGWLGCFANTVREEVRRKPWCHTTHIPEFAEKIEGNELMRPYE